jgi:hypothetical protein
MGTIVDYATTLVLAIATTKVTGVPLPLTTAACMLLGALVHAAFRASASPQADALEPRAAPP